MYSTPPVYNGYLLDLPPPVTNINNNLWHKPHIQIHIYHLTMQASYEEEKGDNVWIVNAGELAWQFIITCV